MSQDERQELASLRASNEQLRAELADKDKIIADLVASTGSQDLQLRRLRRELQDEVIKNDALEQEIKSRDNEIVQLRKAIANLERRIQDALAALNPQE
jgi:hypothetical protein